MSKKKVIRISISNRKILFLVLIVLAGLYAVNLFITSSLNLSIGKEVAEQKELDRPANLDIIIITDSSCKNCYDMENVISFLQRTNSTIASKKTLEFNSSLAKKLIDDNQILFVPSLVISGEVKKSNIASVWQVLNAKVNGDTAVVQGFPPYRDLSTDKIRGLIELVSLNDSICTDCYDVSVHKSIIQRFGGVIEKESTFDVNSSEGKTYTDRYNITKVPTIIMSPEASVYDNLVLVWSGVGTIEKDGWFVFKATEQMGTYKDLSTGKIVSQG